MADTSAPNGGSILETTKNNAAAAYDTIANGPVAQNAKDHAAKASTEFSNLAAARKTPEHPAATGQPLTHYHSFFSELLSWKNPRASAIAYASVVTFIVSLRYLDVVRWAFRLSWMVLGATVAAETAGKLVMNKGLATQFRPRQYYTVPRDTLNNMIGDVHELVNFFVIEAQRIVFAENVAASGAVAVTSFITYYLMKIMPYWGLAIVGTTIAFFAPLIYTTNQELIDQQLKNASEAINTQTAQVREVAQKQADQISTISMQYAGDYSSKVQEMIGGRNTSKPVEKPVENTFEPETTSSNLPTPPTEEPTKVTIIEQNLPEVPREAPKEPLIAV